MAEDLNLEMSSLTEEDLAFFNEPEEKEDGEQPEKEIEKISDELEDKEDKEDIENKEDVSTPSDNNKDDNKSSEFSLFASALAEEGVLTNYDPEKDEVKDFDGLAELVKKTIEENTKNNEFSDLNEEQKNFLQKLRNGFTIDDYVKTKTEEININNIKEDDLEENEDLQKQLIVEDLIESGIPKEKAEKLAQRSFDLGENEKDAKEALASKKVRFENSVKEQEKQRKALIENTKKQHEENIKRIKEKTFNEKEQPFKEIKFNKRIAEEVFKNITEPVGYTDKGEPISALSKARQEDPLEFDYKLNYLFVLTDGFKDLSKIKSDSKSKAAEEFAKKIKQNNEGGFNTSDLDADLESFLNEIEN